MRHIVATVEKKLDGVKNSFWDTEHYCFPDWYTDLDIVNVIRGRSIIPGTEIGMISYKEFEPEAEAAKADAKMQLTRMERLKVASEVRREQLERDADRALGEYFDGMSDRQIAKELGCASYDEACKILATKFLDTPGKLKAADDIWMWLITEELSLSEKEQKEKRAKAQTKYQVGTVVVLDYMDDKQAPRPGTKGIVAFVDDIGQIHVRWETGSSLALIPGVDEFHIG